MESNIEGDRYHGRGRVPGSSTQLASSVIVHFLRPFGSKRHSRALWRREKEPKRHHPPKALPQGRDATAPPVALLNRYARTIKGPAYILFFGAIYTMLKHQGASRTAGDEQAPMSSAPARGPWQQPRSSVLPSLASTGQAPRRRYILSGAFGVSSYVI